MSVGWALAAVALGLVVGAPAHAFKLAPEGSFIERKLAGMTQGADDRLRGRFALYGIRKFGEPVHEQITNRMLGCTGPASICGEPEYEPVWAYYLAGVRWNDDPPFRFETAFGSVSGCQPGNTIRLATFPECWARVFKHGASRAAKGEAFGRAEPMLLHSHFGELQFLHAMASEKGDAPQFTRSRILAWAEFAWRTSSGEFPNGMLLRAVPVPAIAEVFRDRGWSIQDLFALGNPHVRRPEAMSQLAFGTLLHVVQDSFAGGHVERADPDGRTMCGGQASAHLAPGLVRRFHFYGGQDADRHGADDEGAALDRHLAADVPSVVDVGRVLVDYHRRKAAWAEVQPYLECVFALHPDAQPASAGEKYAR